ncbi:MAG: phenylalanine--tRNA ligase subunit beta [Candidatus Thermoplasmatota archaeon]|nr:phenylalanine--tRNA ligase subunit beta [Candidatus Thermoplasmatota archaeon]MBU1940270.1 phenylalanine--tRNA ligase subunit beta [Candidatus Thermoplasmatota archaeon]
MPIVSFNYHDFLKLLGHTIDKETLIEKLPMIGADLDSVNGDEISIEFFPNRPDLTSVEGIARAARGFFGFQPGLPQYKTETSDVVLTVDPSVKSVRPYVVTALIKNITMTDALIASLMDLQEKLHVGLGRNRKKVAIGVHNYEPVTPPFTYKAVDPNAVQFIPLQKTEYMTLEEILVKHEKGVDYAQLLEGQPKYPLIVDAHNNVLSFPPIINGSLTEVTPYTTEIFIDVTGTDSAAINYALNIVTTALVERGSTLYTTTVIDKDTTIRTPNLIPSTRTLSIAYINRLLGTQFTAKEVKQYLEKMGHNVHTSSSDEIRVEIGAWRSDILHEIDLVEDVAVGYGYDVFSTDFPCSFTFGKTLPQQALYTNLRYTMIGLGFTEVTTFSISNPRDECTNLGFEIQPMVTIANPIGEDYSTLRIQLLSSLLKILRENRHHPLPQQIFEVGPVVDADGKNHMHLGGVKIGAKTSFTECKSLVETVFRNIGKEIFLKEYTHPAFITGRCAMLTNADAVMGFLGELHPQTIQTFDLDHPIIAFELFCETLG